MLSEFKAFLTKSNALALAIGVIIGGALGSVVNSLVNDIIMPPIGWALGGVDFASIKTVLGTTTAADGKVTEVAIGWGLFINAVIVFIVVAFVVYLIAYLASLIGLLRFRSWARWLFIIVIGLTLIFTISGGTTLSKPLESLVYTAGNMVDGAILTLLFIEPIRARFRDEPIAPQVPIDPA